MQPEALQPGCPSMRAFLLVIPLALLVGGLVLSNALQLGDTLEVLIVSIAALAGGALAFMLISR
jgi:hypothetical protein